MTTLAYGDRRIRVSMAKELMKQYWSSDCASCKAHNSFQLALCYAMGFALLYNLDESNVWLERSSKSKEDILFQIDYIRNKESSFYEEARLRDLGHEFILEVDQAHEYRIDPGVDLKKIEQESREEMEAIERTLGPTHDVTVNLHASLLDLSVSKAGTARLPVYKRN